ncbi:hypothetical protein [Thermobifida cellulosilytica]|uniref:Uncharacterized protein n=1 Tax=Thermobifida cellulosilytica TB100 TaxID=665004 RepID=A0A147KHR1_THECS|nr:hypothetical protein [Thermobifida cellulosilytica]KUP96828.1 hypothetical protein AC529_10155 [Thermobifida cellulosilytica TB100]
MSDAYWRRGEEERLEERSREESVFFRLFGCLLLLCFLTFLGYRGYQLVVQGWGLLTGELDKITIVLG